MNQGEICSINCAPKELRTEQGPHRCGPAHSSVCYLPGEFLNPASAADVVVQHVTVSVGGQAVVAGRVGGGPAAPGEGSEIGDGAHARRPGTTESRPADEWRARRGSHRGATVRGTHAAGHGVSGAGDAQRPVSDARGREHRAADARGPRAQPPCPVEARRAVQGSAGPAESESPTLAGTAGADR